jgi:ribonuclease P protein subunit RPR2
MGKAKALKEGKNAKNAKSHFKARMEFLDKAANYLQAVTTAPVSVSVSAETQAAGRDDQEFSDKEAEKHMVPEHTLNSSAKEVVKSETDIHSRQMSKKPLANISRVYISHMRGVSLKTLTRLPVPTKRSFCKRCETPLTSGVTCSQEIQNASRGRKKPWADVKVVRCLVCGTEKRFPETERKSKKLVERRQQKQEQEQRQMEAEVPIPAQAQLQSQTQTTQTQDATS